MISRDSGVSGTNSAKLDELIRKLYEGNATRKIPDKHCNRLLAEYDTEQSALKEEAELKEGIIAQAEDAEVCFSCAALHQL